MKIQKSSRSNAEGFVDELIQFAVNHRATNHPLLTAVVKGEFISPKKAIVDICCQYRAFNAVFPQHLENMIPFANDPRHRHALIHHLEEEQGHISEDEKKQLKATGIDPMWVNGVSHPDLYKRMIEAMGIRAEEIEYCDEVIQWRDSFLASSSSGVFARAIGAVGLGNELITNSFYRPMIEGIKRFLDISPRDRVFFDLHVVVDDEHGEIMRNIAIDLSEESEQAKEIQIGMELALNSVCAFMDRMMRRHQARKPSRTELADQISPESLGE